MIGVHKPSGKTKRTTCSWCVIAPRLTMALGVTGVCLGSSPAVADTSDLPPDTFDFQSRAGYPVAVEDRTLPLFEPAGAEPSFDEPRGVRSWRCAGSLGNDSEPPAGAIAPAPAEHPRRSCLR